MHDLGLDPEPGKTMSIKNTIGTIFKILIWTVDNKFLDFDFDNHTLAI